ncbi:sterol desaturase family protein [Pseudodesulfovibrio sp. zrk46]|uniref:sterol desaturase family protein n=1 Tax=Pseudodesulfovibrio sp. zrk46 TaxID=2725288 RepID=UPI0014498D5F|nr:sterol desaturase family protein [Pseudodesulfovibrio sp. zrk46]QJB57966.1 sterol desaturase family protein [Pseudodesulfovibrio sp. zrk46]
MLSETSLRIGSFLTVLIIMGALETLWPRRVLDAPKLQRWFTNLSMVGIASVLTRILLPIMPAGLAVYCSNHNLGLFQIIELPALFTFILSVLFLDLIIYWQHVAFHSLPLLWRLHRMHHADLNIDASTGIRFHPIEILLSMFLKLLAVLTLGPPAAAVITFEILLNGCALFNHANVRLPLHVDRWLRLLMVTPDMHRVHHSTDAGEFNTNYGFNFPWWDRIFHTYKAQPDLGHEGMQIGLKIYREPRYSRLLEMLTMPFK